MSGWFLIDAPASFPFEWVAVLIPGLDSSNLQYMAALKCIRLLRLGRLLKFFDRFQFANVARLVRLIAFFVLCTHWAGCLFWLVGDVQGMDSPGVWINEWGLINSGFGSRYLASLYAGLLQLVGENIDPQTDVERLFAISVILYGDG